MKNTLRIALTAGALLYLAAPAHAARAVAVELAFDAQILPGRDFDMLSGDDLLPAVSVIAGYELIEGLSLELGYQDAQSGSRLFDGSFKTGFQLRGTTAGLRYRYPLTQWLAPWLRAGGGAWWGRFRLDAGRGARASDSGWRGGGYALAGAELRVSDAVLAGLPPGFAITLSGGAGLTARAPWQFRSGGVNLGKLDLTGAQLQLSGGVSYAF